MLFTNGPPKGKDEKSIVQLRAIFGKKKKKRCHTCLMDAANVLSSGGCASIDPETMPVLEIPGKSSLSRTHSKEPAGARLLCRTRVSLRHNGRVTSWRLTSQKRREPIDQFFFFDSWWFSSSSSCWLAGWAPQQPSFTPFQLYFAFA